MADITESSTWENGIYQLEKTDRVEAGPNGIANRQAKELANRTKYLYDRAGKVIEITDFNQVTSAGVYHLSFSNWSSIANKPNFNDVRSAILVVNNPSLGYYIQRLYISKNGVYDIVLEFTRVKASWNGLWSPWTNMHNSKLSYSQLEIICGGTVGLSSRLSYFGDNRVEDTPGGQKYPFKVISQTYNSDNGSLKIQHNYGGTQYDVLVQNTESRSWYVIQKNSNDFKLIWQKDIQAIPVAFSVNFVVYKS